MKMSERGLLPCTPYGINHCLSDIYAAKELAPGSRGAGIAAAKKRLKAEIAIKWVMQVSHLLDLDMTPTFAMKLIKGWTARCISRPVLLREFGIPGRSAAYKSSDIALVDGLIEGYKIHVNNEIAEAMAAVNIACIREGDLDH